MQVECRVIAALLLRSTYVDARLAGPSREVEEVHGHTNSFTGTLFGSCKCEKRMRIGGLKQVLAKLTMLFRPDYIQTER